MKRALLFLLLLSQFAGYGQRSGRRAYSSTPVYETYVQPTFSGRYFDIMLTNPDTIPVLLKLGPGKKIENKDTVNLTRIYPCNNPGMDEYYDLDYPTDWENSCVRWYTLQLIKPRDTLHFTVKLRDFAERDTARLYFYFTNNIKKTDKDLDLYSDPKKIYIMKDGRDFETGYIKLSASHPNSIIIQCR